MRTKGMVAAALTLAALLGANRTVQAQTTAQADAAALNHLTGASRERSASAHGLYAQSRGPSHRQTAGL